MPTFNSCTKCVSSLSIINDHMPVCYPVSLQRCMDDLITKRCFDSQATCVIDVFGLFSWHLSMAFYTTRHWQTSGGLVQKLKICTVSRTWKRYGLWIIQKTAGWQESSREKYSIYFHRLAIFELNTIFAKTFYIRHYL